VSTAGYVKLLLPPRQSRGNSHWGLERGRHFAGTCRRAHFNPDDRQRSRLIVRGRV
jgi:hypothetical protein